MKITLFCRPIIASMLLLICSINSAIAEQLFPFKNGMVIRGSKAEIATLKEGFGAAAAGQINVRPIWLIDDGLRRVYVHGKRMSAGPPVDVADRSDDVGPRLGFVVGRHAVFQI